VKINDYQTVKNTINDIFQIKIKIIDNVDEIGWTALHWACYYGYENLVELLIHEGNADLDSKTLEGLGDVPTYKNKTAEEIAKLKGYKKCANKIWRCKMKRMGKQTLRFFKSLEEIPKAVVLQ